MAGKTNEMKTEMTAAEIAAGIEKPWRLDEGNEVVAGENDIILVSGRYLCDEDALAIVNAVNATYVAGYAPEGIAPVVEALKYYKAICGNTGYGVDPENARIAYDLAMKALDAITIKPKNQE